MKFRWAVIFFLFLSLQSWGAGSRRHSAKQTASIDSGYLAALATANRFLYAWQIGDLENGMVLLSDNVRRSQGAEKLEQFFSGSPDRAFEITRGNGHRGRYRFPVVLVMKHLATKPRVAKPDRGVQRTFSEIILVNTGKNDWVVDKLP